MIPLLNDYTPNGIALLGDRDHTLGYDPPVHHTAAPRQPGRPVNFFSYDIIEPSASHYVGAAHDFSRCNLSFASGSGTTLSRPERTLAMKVAT